MLNVKDDDEVLELTIKELDQMCLSNQKRIIVVRGRLCGIVNEEATYK